MQRFHLVQARAALVVLMAFVLGSDCSTPGSSYGGYTKGEAKDAAQYGLQQLAKEYQGEYKAVGLPTKFSTSGYKIIGAEKSKANTGSDAWLVTFVNDALGDQVCITVWRNDETGDAGRWQQTDC